MAIILDLCGGTGAWSAPYAEAGYDVRLITLPEHDVRLYELPKNTIIHGVLAAPPCTVFAGSGARWLRTDDDMREGLSVVDACIRIIHATQPAWWCLENPVGKVTRWLGKWEMTFQPYDYGDPYTKRTCLWGDFTPPIKQPVEPIEGGKMHRLPPGKDRTALRSITPPAFAKAFFKVNP